MGKRKSAEELGIQVWEYDALLQVRDLLATGKIEHNRDLLRRSKDVETRPTKRIFNMEITHDPDRWACGTVGCIGGWVWALHKNDDRAVGGPEYVKGHEYGGPLGRLYYPKLPGGVAAYKSITPKQAVIAIDNFLTTGNPDWKAVVAP